MKLPLRCSSCSVPDDESEGEVRRISFHDITNDGVYETRCERGHTNFTVLQNPRFELLFDAAALALRDSYHREAVASCAGALEEFYAFYVRVFLRARGSDAKAIERFGKDTRLSERRLGAMYLAYLLERGEVFALDERKRREFRNNVIHDGYWPSAVEAREYVTYVFETISELAHPLRAAHGEEFNAELVAHLASGHAKARQRPKGQSTRYGSSTIVTMLNFSINGKRRTFEEAFARWRDLQLWDDAKFSTERPDP